MNTNFKQKLSIAITGLFVIGFAFFVYAEQPFDKSVFNDSDQDGLSDEEEKMYKSDPFNRDTDGDGYSDGAEIKSGYDPLKPAPGDKIINTDNQQTGNQVSEIDPALSEFDSEFISFLNQKGEADVSMDELQAFVSGSIGSEMELSEESVSLTEEEIASIEIKKQDYSGLDEQDRTEKEKEDAINYLAQVLEILIANYPGTLEETEDFKIAYENFISKLENLGSDNPDYEYFRNLGEKLALAQGQIKLVEVPESFLELHIRLLAVNKGFLSLRDFSLPMEDATGKIVIISRSMALGERLADMMADLSRKMSALY